MGLFDFLKNMGKSKPKNQERTENSSDHELKFAQTILEFIGPSVEKYGFLLHRREVKQYSTNIVWRKNKQYIKVNSTTYPTDYPYYYNLVLGEGDSDNIFEYDWNSVAIWALARVINPQSDAASYDFPYDDKVKLSVETAHHHLLTYGQSFLNGDLTIFYAARKMINRDREPYKISSPDKDGNYQTRDEPKSAEQKKKYS